MGGRDQMPTLDCWRLRQGDNATACAHLCRNRAMLQPLVVWSCWNPQLCMHSANVPEIYFDHPIQIWKWLRKLSNWWILTFFLNCACACKQNNTCFWILSVTRWQFLIITNSRIRIKPWLSSFPSTILFCVCQVSERACVLCWIGWG